MQSEKDVWTWTGDEGKIRPGKEPEKRPAPALARQGGFSSLL
jgi:hypothetical protein